MYSMDGTKNASFDENFQKQAWILSKKCSIWGHKNNYELWQESYKSNQPSKRKTINI